MTPERAREIIEAGRKWADYPKHCTETEVALVLRLRLMLPNNMGWLEALQCFARGDETDGRPME